MGNESHQVELLGVGGEPLVVHDEILDFGPTTAWGGGGSAAPHSVRIVNVKEVKLQNIDPSQALPVSFVTSSSSEVRIEDVIIPPASSLRVPIEFRPAKNGPWSGTVIVTAPPSAQKASHVRRLNVQIAQNPKNVQQLRTNRELPQI